MSVGRLDAAVVVDELGAHEPMYTALTAPIECQSRTDGSLAGCCQTSPGAIIWHHTQLDVVSMRWVEVLCCSSDGGCHGLKSGL